MSSGSYTTRSSFFRGDNGAIRIHKGDGGEKIACYPETASEAMLREISWVGGGGGCAGNRV